jgi:phage antirepressor YoqD-like protein
MTKLSIVPKNSDTLLENRSLRDRYADKVEALERVGKLTMLPDDLHVTIDMAANFYQVPIKTVHTVIQRHKDELMLDGMKVIGGSDFANFKVKNANSLSLSPMARSTTVITRQALLRIGMVLRDSEVAKALRTYLVKLDEVVSKNASEFTTMALTDTLSAHNLPSNYAGAIFQLFKTINENRRLSSEIEAAKDERRHLSSKARRFDEFLNSEGQLYIGDVAKFLGIPEMGPNNLFQYLRDKGVMFKDWKKRNVPIQKYIDRGYFEVGFTKGWLFGNGEVLTTSKPVTYVTPKGVVFIWDLLVKDGYRPDMKGKCLSSYIQVNKITR